MKCALLLAVAAALFVVGCGDDSASDTTTTAVEMTTIKVYFLRDGNIWPVAREVDETERVQATVDALLLGPTEEERQLGFTSAYSDVPASELSRAGLAQLVYTMTQFSSGDFTVIEGVNYTRADFEDQTPPVLVESPLPFEEVPSPLRVAGTANTFEATFNYELTDTDGLIVDENFVTATSGTGTRGTFDFTTEPYTVPFDGIGSLIVFERSAEDGSRIHIVEIPLRMTR